MPNLPFKKRKAAERSSSQKPLIEEEPRDAGQPLEVEAQMISDAERPQPDPPSALQGLHLVLVQGPQPGPSETAVLMQTFWKQIVARPAEPCERNLREHLRRLQAEVLRQLDRLRPHLQPRGLMGPLVACCRLQVAAHLQDLLRGAGSSGSCLHLIGWARLFLSHQEFQRTDCQRIDEWDEWETNAKDKLFQNVQDEVRVQLENILRDHKSQTTCDTEEVYVGLHVDVIQCVSTLPEQVKSVDEELSNRVLQVCSEELLTFVKGYDAWQREFLEERAGVKPPQTVHFLKTLRTCKELRKHVREEDMQETVAMLDQMDTFTRDLLGRVVIGDVKKNLRRYFKLDSRRTFPFAALEAHFPRLPFAEDEHKAVMGDVYRDVAHLYFRCLIGNSRRKLTRWSDDVGATVCEDAVWLHGFVSARVPDVHQYNRLLLSVDEVLALPKGRGSLDSMKVTMATIQKEGHRQSDDLRLLPDLLLWTGLPRRDVRAVMEALPVQTPLPKSPFWALMSCCCC